MYRQEVRDFEGWRAAARPLLAGAVRPEEVVWSDWRAPSLGTAAANTPAPGPDAAGSPKPIGSLNPTGAAGADAGPPSGAPSGTARVPAISRRLLRLLEELACYRDPD